MVPVGTCCLGTLERVVDETSRTPTKKLPWLAMLSGGSGASSAASAVLAKNNAASIAKAQRRNGRFDALRPWMSLGPARSGNETCMLIANREEM
jgi:hypothetical protein